VEYEKYNNPADFFIDTIIRNESSMHGVDASDEDIITMKSKEQISICNIPNTIFYLYNNNDGIGK